MATAHRKARTFVLAIGGLDPSAGAGILADVRSIEAMGAMPLAIATSLTVQSGRGLRSYKPVSSRLLLAQIRELRASLPIAAVKIGQLPTKAMARALLRELETLDCPLVFDPVCRASGGGRLVARGEDAAIARFVFPLASLVTVNLDEAAALTGLRVTSITDMRRAAARLLELGPGAVLVKGGHLAGDPVDLLALPGKEKQLRSRRLAASMHGTGCALASAAAARLALGDEIPTAVEAARRHVRALLGSSVAEGTIRLRAPLAGKAPKRR